MRKNVFFGVIAVLVFVMFTVSAVKVIRSDSAVTEEPEVNTEVFEFFEGDAKKIENSIRKGEQERIKQFGGTTKKEIEETLLRLENGEISLRQIFADTFIAGDSLMEGIEYYGVLGSDYLATQVSASLSHLEENMDTIISTNPPELILHYGLNMISFDDSQLENFIYEYSELISELKQELPTTRIIVSGIFPVDTSEGYIEEEHAVIPDYNKALEQMCKELDVEYLDSTPAFQTGVDYYEPDGIHVVAKFYSEAWLPFVIENKGIIK